jgi:hypothetical protein
MSACETVEVSGSWTKLPNEELHDLVFLPHVTRRMRWAWHRNAYILIGKHEGKRLFGKPSNRCNCNIQRMWLGLIWLSTDVGGGLL